MLNTSYLNRIAVSIFAQEFIISNRLFKIQRFYRLRYAQRVKAARLITFKAKIYLVSRGTRDMERARLYFSRAQFAINRIAELYHSLKIKKVQA